ncbi:helix-turn-helix transcriptional regulator [Saccharopolyspora sp. 5N708]|uniref:helix-turn-helix transcriptional regulator n=1 Tax=Saccharopolyspora sp. 5N708 TaxID=3457424 RepID=UPI003FD5BDD2
MAREQVSIEGRERALAALRSALRGCVRRGRLVIVRGPAGIGKTRLMEAAARRWRSEGVRVAQVRVGGRAGSDHYGVGATIDALRDDFDRLGDAGLIDGVSLLARLRAREATDPRGWLPAMAIELSRVFGRIGCPGPAAVFFDDVLGVADPALLLIAARRPGCLVVASLRHDTVPSRAATELVNLADEVIDLGPLTDDQIVTVAGEADDDLHQALRTALGPLYGNPGTVVATLEALRRQLVEVGDRLHLNDPASPIALPDGHDLLRRARQIGDLAPRMLAAAATFGTLDVDDLPRIADSLGEDLTECGRTVDRLVECGALATDAQGRLGCLCPALAASIAITERDTVRRLRAAMTASVSEVRTEPEIPANLPRKRAVAESARTAVSQVWSTAETRLVDLISLGFTNRRIASEIGVSEKTVERYLTRLFAKTGCRSRVELVAASMEGRLWGGLSPAYGPAA